MRFTDLISWKSQLLWFCKFIVDQKLSEKKISWVLICRKHSQNSQEYTGLEFLLLLWDKDTRTTSHLCVKFTIKWKNEPQSPASGSFDVLTLPSYGFSSFLISYLKPVLH